MQSLRMKFGERRTDWRCCFCCHVRTGTIFLGMYHLLMNMLTLSALALVMRYPEYFDDEMNHDVLPTPLSEIDDDRYPKLRIEGVDLSDRRLPMPHSYRTVIPSNQRDWNITVFFTMCTLGLSFLLLYGAIKRKPSYIMPFFGFQVFNFCVTSMATIGYLCYPPNFNQMVQQNPYMPFREELLQVNPHTLSLYAVLALLLSIMIKAYFIGVVWSCYKYLTLRAVSAQRTLHFIDPDNQNLIHGPAHVTTDLPDYETAIKKFPVPPPSYATAVLGEVDASAATTSAAAPVAGATTVIRTTTTADKASQGSVQQV